VEQFLAGASNELSQLLKDAIPAAEKVSPFQQNLQLNDLEILGSFFERGPKRNRDLRERHGISGPIIPQEQLDDLLVVARNETETAAHEKEPEATLI
jgi:hypothetical protein